MIYKYSFLSLHVKTLHVKTPLNRPHIFFKIDDKIESMFNSKRTVKDVATPLGNAPGATGGSGGGAAANLAKLEAAKRLASKISLVKNIGAQVGVTRRFQLFWWLV